MTRKPKFKVGDEVVYHAGNWKWRVVAVLKHVGGGGFTYFVTCQNDSCVCGEDTQYDHFDLHNEADLISYDEWCDHTDKGTCKICCN